MLENFTLFPECGEEHKPPLAPPPPRFTKQEELLFVIKKVNDALGRVLSLEKLVESRFNEYITELTADNTTFKKLCTDTYNTFAKGVQEEVNSFETTITNAFELFKNDKNVEIEDFKTAIEGRITEYYKNLDEIFNNFVKEMDTYVEKIVEGEIREGYANFTEEITSSFNEHKQEIENRIDGQNAMINDAYAYMKTNLGVTLENVMNEMIEDGRLDTISLETYEKIRTFIGATINVKEKGVVGDGVTDDTDALQSLLDSCEEGATLYFPSGIYKISRTLLIPSKIKLVGQHKSTTKIVKSGNEVDSKYSIDAIFCADVMKGDLAYSEQLFVEQLILSSENNSTYGIYFPTSASHMVMDNIGVWNVGTGIYFNDGSWVSEFSNVDIGNVDYGVYYKNNGTSTNFRNIYVMTAQECAYYIKGLAYSHWENVCADWCKKNVYKFEYCKFTINGIGSECRECSNVFYVNNSTMTISSGIVFNNFTNADYKMIELNGSTLELINIATDTDSDSVRECAGALYRLSTQAFLKLVDCEFKRTKYLTANSSNDKNNNYVEVRKNGAVISFYSGKSEMGYATGKDEVEKCAPEKTLLNAIHFNNIDNPSKGLQGDTGWMRRRQCGDVFVNNKPSSGVALWIQKSSGIVHTLVSKVIAVSENTLVFSSLNVDENAVAFGVEPVVGETIDNGEGNGASSTITAIDKELNTITVSDASKFSIGDTIRFNITNWYIRDQQYAIVQSVLHGWSSKRPSNPRNGMMYFDTTLCKPIWYCDGRWFDATGTIVAN